jgi:hypothetical protein
MGFSITDNITIEDTEIQVSNTYATISGQYNVSRRYIYSNNNNLLYEPYITSHKYLITCQGNIYKDRQRYLAGKSPLICNINLSLLVDSMDGINIYNMLYTKLKEYITERYAVSNFIDYQII